MHCIKLIFALLLATVCGQREEPASSTSSVAVDQRRRTMELRVRAVVPPRDLMTGSYEDESSSKSMGKGGSSSKGKGGSKGSKGKGGSSSKSMGKGR
jgi:uncharacterized membrane protein YgcG